MSEMPEECVDLVITDPPFAIDFKATRHNYNRKENRVLQGYNEIEGSDYLAFTLDWLSAATRVLKDSGSMYIFSGWNHLKDLLIAIDECQLTTVNHLIWKYQFGVVTKRKYVTSHNRGGDDFQKVYTFLETLYISSRLVLPLKGTILIGY